MKKFMLFAALLAPFAICAEEQEVTQFECIEPAMLSEECAPECYFEQEMGPCDGECIPVYEGSECLPMYDDSECVPMYTGPMVCPSYEVFGLPYVCGSFFGFAEYLYWQAYEEGLDYVISSPSGAPTPPYAPDTFPEALDDNTQYRSGVRTGVGYAKDWDTAIYWTYFYTNPHNSLDATAGNTPLVPLLLNTSAGPVLLAANGSSAEGTWHLNYNVLDWELGYVLPWENFMFRPHLGVRAAWIYQTIDVEYTNVSFIDVTPPSPVADFGSHETNNFWGVGLRVGGDGNWNFWRRFSFFGRSGLSLLSGQFDVSQRAFLTSTFAAVPAGAEVSRTKVERNQLASAMDLSAGIGWSRPCGYLNLACSVAWEFQIWFAQNQLLEVVEGAHNFRYVNQRGDLTIQGLTARLEAAF